MPHDEGRKSRCRLVTTITKRSSHMPTLTTIATRLRQRVHFRTFRNHRDCGVMMLQKMSVQYLYQYGPFIRFQIMNPSYLFPLYQPKKASDTYPYPTMSAVTSVTFPMFSRWRIVMKPSRPYSFRSGIASVSTIANPA